MSEGGSCICSRLVCEVLLSHLNLGNEMTWREFVHLIRKLIGGVDYKVRDENIIVLELTF